MFAINASKLFIQNPYFTTCNSFSNILMSLFGTKHLRVYVDPFLFCLVVSALLFLFDFAIKCINWPLNSFQILWYNFMLCFLTLWRKFCRSTKPNQFYSYSSSPPLCYLASEVFLYKQKLKWKRKTAVLCKNQTRKQWSIQPEQPNQANLTDSRTRQYRNGSTNPTTIYLSLTNCCTLWWLFRNISLPV